MVTIALRRYFLGYTAGFLAAFSQLAMADSPKNISLSHQTESLTAEDIQAFVHSLFPDRATKQNMATLGCSQQLTKAAHHFNPSLRINDFVAFSGFSNEHSFIDSRAKFLAQREADFVLGRTTVLDGWVVARSEVSVAWLSAWLESKT